jgi:hypothetical protein
VVTNGLPGYCEDLSMYSSMRLEHKVALLGGAVEADDGDEATCPNVTAEGSGLFR